MSAKLERLRALGVSLARDDFGSGFSSFGYLARLPLDELKLDRIFVQGLDSDQTSEAVTRSVVSLCRELDLTLLCEGVETVAQKDMLKALGSDEAQGYLFGRPEPQQQFLERIAEFLAATARSDRREHSQARRPPLAPRWFSPPRLGETGPEGESAAKRRRWWEASTRSCGSRSCPRAGSFGFRPLLAPRRRSAAGGR